MVWWTRGPGTFGYAISFASVNGELANPIIQNVNLGYQSQEYSN